MSNFVTVRVEGMADEQMSSAVEDFDSVTVDFGSDSGGPQYYCENCYTEMNDSTDTDTYGRPLDDERNSVCSEDEEDCPECDGEMLVPSDDESAVNGQEACERCDGTGRRGLHKRAERPLTWFNWAGVSVNEEDNSVSVQISAGDPRGSFQMTMRKLDDGSIMLYVPEANMGMPHMPMKVIAPGAFEVSAADVKPVSLAALDGDPR